MRYHLTPVRMDVINKSKNNKYWWRCGERGTLLHCWWECRLVQPLWKAVWRYLKKLKMDLLFDRVIPLLGTDLKEAKILIQKNISTPMFIAALLINQDMEAAQVSISRWVDKTVGHSHNGILLSHKKEENFTLCGSMGEPGELYAKWNKSVRERKIPYDFTYMWNSMNKIN